MGRYIVLTLFFSLAFAGCADSTKSELDALKKSVESIQADSFLNEIIRNGEGVAYLTPGDAGYSVLKCDIGALTVKLEDVKSYANGSRVSLQFGNPLAATINGIKATVEWGRVDSKGSPDNSNAKSKELRLTQALRGGAWTDVPIVLDGIPPSELGFVRIKDLKHTGISLSQ